jgi:hypothetical protein
MTLKAIAEIAAGGFGCHPKYFSAELPSALIWRAVVKIVHLGPPVVIRIA